MRLLFILLFFTSVFGDYGGGYAGSGFRYSSNARDFALAGAIIADKSPGFYAFSNPWGNSASSYHVLPEGTYHIVLYGANQSDGSPVSDVNLHAFALPLNNSQESNVRIGPFEPYPNNNLPDVKELLNKIK